MAEHSKVTLMLKKEGKGIKIIDVFLGTKKQTLRRESDLLKRTEVLLPGVTIEDVEEYEYRGGYEYVEVYATDVRGY